MPTDREQERAAAQERARRHRLFFHDQMMDAQSRCLPCKLCGGRAIISDAGFGAGYYIRCENQWNIRVRQGCMIGDNRLGGWAYNVMEWWNRLHAPGAEREAIITFLREVAAEEASPDDWGQARAREIAFTFAADAIARGDHLLARSEHLGEGREDG